MTGEKGSTGKDEILPASTGAVLAWYMGWTLGTPIDPAAAEVIGVALTPPMERAARRIIGEIRRKNEVVAVAAAEQAGLSQDELVARLSDRPELQPLLQRVLDAARRSNHEQKLVILGRILGEAVTDRPRTVDVDSMYVSALDDIEAGHVRVLELVARQADPRNPGARWSVDQLEVAVTDLPAEAVHAAAGGLIRHGLIASSPCNRAEWVWSDVLMPPVCPEGLTPCSTSPRSAA